MSSQPPRNPIPTPVMRTTAQSVPDSKIMAPSRLRPRPDRTSFDLVLEFDSSSNQSRNSKMNTGKWDGSSRLQSYQCYRPYGIYEHGQTQKSSGLPQAVDFHSLRARQYLLLNTGSLSESYEQQQRSQRDFTETSFFECTNFKMNDDELSYSEGESYAGTVSIFCVYLLIL